MTVTIPSTENHSGHSLATFEIPDTCPECGGPRGRVFGTHSFDGSRQLNCDGWNNPCGHIDTYADIRATGEKTEYRSPAPYGCYRDRSPFQKNELAEGPLPGAIETIVHSNGSSMLGGNKPLEKLFESLEKYTIEERFFTAYQLQDARTKLPIERFVCPISADADGFVRFFGNFEEVSHVFLFYSNDPAIVGPVSEAIRNNKGWKKYYFKNCPPALLELNYSPATGPYVHAKTNQ